MKFKKLPNKKYSIIYADPPWKYNDQMPSKSKAINHYSTLSTKDICKLPVRDITEDNALLFIWVTGPHLEEALQVVSAWGFKYRTVAFVWHKENRKNIGYYTFSSCEYVLVAKRGKIPEGKASREQQFLSLESTKHSEKPKEVQERIEIMFPTHKKIELFARNKRRGWTSWGNEV